MIPRPTVPRTTYETLGWIQFRPLEIGVVVWECAHVPDHGARPRIGGTRQEGQVAGEGARGHPSFLGEVQGATQVSLAPESGWPLPLPMAVFRCLALRKLRNADFGMGNGEKADGK